MLNSLPFIGSPMSPDKQDLTAQKAALEQLWVSPERIYIDRGLIGTNRVRPGLDQVLATVRTGDTLVMPHSTERIGQSRDQRACVRNGRRMRVEPHIVVRRYK